MRAGGVKTSGNNSGAVSMHTRGSSSGRHSWTVGENVVVMSPMAKNRGSIQVEMQLFQSPV